MKQNRLLYFKEIQKFRSLLLWMFIIILASTFLYGVIQQVIFDRPFGDKPAPDKYLIILFITFGIGLPLLFHFSNLKTEVRKDGIYFKFIPFHVKYQQISFSDIKNYKIKNYRPLREYGGWGIRYGAKGRAYSVFGSVGIEFELNNGNKILLGTQEPDNFKNAINKVME